ncbi:hypothetical protein A9972_22105 [Pseudomonas sp. UME83]|nr:hypothetical protein [Pseudomonas sp. UMC76]MBB1640734.1 hypothetical protein [Pseudomonas sp. UME83]
MIHFHSWGMWSRLLPSYNGHKTQFRECLTCGQAQFRDLGYCDGVNFELANEALSEVGPVRDSDLLGEGNEHE